MFEEEVKKILDNNLLFHSIRDGIGTFRLRKSLAKIAEEICQKADEDVTTVTLSKDMPQHSLDDYDLAFELREAIQQNVSEDELSYFRISAVVSKTILPIIAKVIAKTASIVGGETTMEIFEEIEKKFDFAPFAKIEGWWIADEDLQTLKKKYLKVMPK